MRKRAKIILGIVVVVLVLGGVYAYNTFLFMMFIEAEAIENDLRLEMKHLAGSPDGIAGFSDGQGPDALMAKPIRLAPLNDSTVVFADINNHAIRSIDLNGNVNTLAGDPDKQGYKDGPASEAMFDSPHGVAVRQDGVIAVAEANNNTIRLFKLIQTLAAADSYYEVSTLAGVPGQGGFKDGINEEAMFDAPHAVAWGEEGELYVADIGNSRIRMIQNSQTTTIAGTGKSGKKNGGNGVGTLAYPMDIALDDFGQLWIIDAKTLTLRKWRTNEGLTTPFPDLEIAMPHGVAIDQNGDIVVAEMYGQRIISFDKVTGETTVICGEPAEGIDSTHLRKPAAVLVHAGYLWVADLGNNRITLVEYK